MSYAIEVLENKYPDSLQSLNQVIENVRQYGS